MIRRPPRSTQSRASAASDVYKRQRHEDRAGQDQGRAEGGDKARQGAPRQLQEPGRVHPAVLGLSLIHISEPTRLGMISYAVFCLKKKKKTNNTTAPLILFPK